MNVLARSDDYHVIRSIVDPLAADFAGAGHRLYLVGGVVRDLLVGHHGALEDIDLTTDARPPVIKALLAPRATALWDQGERFGTIGATIGGRDIEVTTHRAESYDPASRKPEVSFGDDLETDLSRRDFTINAMAIAAGSDDLVDPFGGAEHLRDRLLATPLDPEVSFTDDPLRMLRAARFIPRFDLHVDPKLREAVVALASRLSIVSVERIHDEFERLLGLDDPTAGLTFLQDTGLLGFIGSPLRCRDVSALADRDARRAALLVPDAAASSDAARDWLTTMRYSKQALRSTRHILDALAAFRAAPDGDVAELLRRTIAAGSLDASWAALDVLELDEVDGAGSVRPHWLRPHLSALAASEDLHDLGSPVSGGDLIAEFGLSPGPAVGDLIKRLAEHRLSNGPFGRQEAFNLVRDWLS